MNPGRETFGTTSYFAGVNCLTSIMPLRNMPGQWFGVVG
jgi:hypothetical protein